MHKGDYLFDDSVGNNPLVELCFSSEMVKAIDPFNVGYMQSVEVEAIEHCSTQERI